MDDYDDAELDDYVKVRPKIYDGKPCCGNRACGYDHGRTLLTEREAGIFQPRGMVAFECHSGLGWHMRNPNVRT